VALLGEGGFAGKVENLQDSGPTVASNRLCTNWEICSPLSLQFLLETEAECWVECYLNSLPEKTISEIFKNRSWKCIFLKTTILIKWIHLLDL
jgi:hypothetical protein